MLQCFWRAYGCLHKLGLWSASDGLLSAVAPLPTALVLQRMATPHVHSSQSRWWWETWVMFTSWKGWHAQESGPKVLWMFEVAYTRLERTRLHNANHAAVVKVQRFGLCLKRNGVYKTSLSSFPIFSPKMQRYALTKIIMAHNLSTSWIIHMCAWDTLRRMEHHNPNISGCTLRTGKESCGVTWTSCWPHYQDMCARRKLRQNFASQRPRITSAWQIPSGCRKSEFKFVSVCFLVHLSSMPNRMVKQCANACTCTHITYGYWKLPWGHPCLAKLCWLVAVNDAAAHPCVSHHLRTPLFHLHNIFVFENHTSFRSTGCDV